MLKYVEAYELIDKRQFKANRTCQLISPPWTDAHFPPEMAWRPNVLVNFFPKHLRHMFHNPALVARFPGFSTAARNPHSSESNPTKSSQLQSRFIPIHHQRTSLPPTICIFIMSAGWPGRVCNTTFAAPLQLPSRSRNTNTNIIPSLSLCSRIAGQWSVMQPRPKGVKASHKTKYQTSNISKTCHLSLRHSCPNSRFVSPKMFGFWLWAGRGCSLRFGPERRTGIVFQRKTNSGI
ncbi:hypothetical protein BKA64DRAFT_131059 [Cadophora sp. MPI-SDFR-AT-0126]|nr:hypothetical protein BKA64DRAFT_131059 [Leotiomycetes sp. MPI-SDFR-AT-0126]